MKTSSRSVLQRLISFDTTSRNSNLQLIEWAADHMDRCGAHVDLIYNTDRNKANLLATIGPHREGGIVLSGHTDVVPVDHQQWRSDPFSLTERDGRLYGRGTSDMKGFIACTLAAAGTWRSLRLQRPIHCALSYDEEVGCLGVPALADRIADSLPPPAFAIVGEPTDMRIGVAHNGVIGLHTSFVGIAAHASAPSRGVNAIDAAAAFISFLSDVAKRPNIAGHGCTLNVGRIAGGTATNIVAERCSVHWEFRSADDADVASIKGMIDEYLDGVRRTALDVVNDSELEVPPFSSRLGAGMIEMLGGFCAKSQPTALGFGSEAGIFEKRGIPTVVCGPGSIEQAHRPDEWIARSALDEADEFMERVAAWATAADRE